MTSDAPGHIHLSRAIPAIQVPGGEPVTLAEGTPVVVTQTLGGAYTLYAPSLGGLFRVDGRDADALGLSPSPPAGTAPAPARRAGPVTEEEVLERLRTCYDPEIPVNIVDLGLVYDVSVTPRPSGGSRVGVKMTLTAPGCGMGPAIAADARWKVQSIPGVEEAEVALVWDPPWSAEMMTPEARRTLGMG